MQCNFRYFKGLLLHNSLLKKVLFKKGTAFLKFAKLKNNRMTVTLVRLRVRYFMQDLCLEFRTSILVHVKN